MATVKSFHSLHALYKEGKESHLLKLRLRLPLFSWLPLPLLYKEFKACSPSILMAEKISTIIIHHDLDCCSCYEKITKILCKFHCIQTMTFDSKQKTLTISGPFDPDQLMKSLSCKAGKYIKSYEIVQKKPPPPSDQKQTKDKDVKPDQSKDSKPNQVAKPDQSKPIQVVVPIQVNVVGMWSACGHFSGESTTPASTGPACCRPCCGNDRRTCCTSCYEGNRGGPCWLGQPSAPTSICYKSQYHEEDSSCKTM